MHRRPSSHPCSYCTVSVSVVVDVIEPDVPVRVTVYGPGVVPGDPPPPLPPPLLLPPPPPHEIVAARMANSTRARTRFNERRRSGTNKIITHANTAVPPGYQCEPGRMGRSSDPLVAVVLIARLAVEGLNSSRLTELLPPKVNDGGFCAPAGLAVMDADSATLPTNPLTGVTVIVEEVEAPLETVALVPVNPNPAPLGADTTTEEVPVPEL